MLNSERIYLDNNATTALDERVINVMLQEYKRGPANPSSIHSFGQEAKNLLAKARRSIADKLAIFSGEIIFTSGGTEAINLALKGMLAGQTSGHIISSSVEHKATLSVLKELEYIGFSVSYLNPGMKGYISKEQVQEHMTDQTVLVCLMAVNNETGVKTPQLNEIGKNVKENGAYLFIDAISVFGKEPFDIPNSASAIAFAAHKFHGPKGAGFLVLRQDVPFTSQLLGGAQEYGKRAGTENLAAILGMEKAIEIIHTEIDEISEKVSICRDLFEQLLLKELEGVHVNGDGERISNTSNLSFDGIEGESMLMNLDLSGVAVSHGSACTSGSLEPSHVLLNMGYDKERVNASIRFSFSKLTTREEVLKTVSLVKKIALKLREQFN